MREGSGAVRGRKLGKGAGMAGDYVLAIDQGTTSSRAIVFNHDSATVGEANHEPWPHGLRHGLKGRARSCVSPVPSLKSLVSSRSAASSDRSS